MDKTALANIFMPDRERKANVNHSRMLEELVITALKEDSRLRAYAAEIRRRRASEHVEDKQEAKNFLQELAKVDPALKELFGLGKFLLDTTTVPGDEKKFVGEKFPTFLDPLNLRQENGVFVKEVPVGSSRRIECGTNAENDYFSRIDSPGETWCSRKAEELPHRVRLWNGTATFTIRAPETVKPSDSTEVEFGFRDHGRNIEPLKFRVRIDYTQPEERQKGKPGEKRDTKSSTDLSLALPEFIWVAKTEWSEYSFDEQSGAYVDTSDRVRVYINRDNRFLSVMRVKEKDEAETILNENMFKYGLGIFALSIQKRALEQANESAAINPEDIVRLSTSALAPHVITVIRRLGGTLMS